MPKLCVAAAALCLGAGSLFADFSYQESSQITGGAIAGMLKMASAFSKEAGQPIQTAVYVQGNRMARISARRAELYDLDKETITSVDLAKKTYSVMTFEEMRQTMQKAMAQAGSGDQKPPQGNLDVKVSLTENGQHKEVAGLPANGMLMNLVMAATDEKGQTSNLVVTSDVYVAKGVAGYQEVRDFQRKLGQKMAYAMGGGFAGMAAGAQGAQMAKGMSALYQESAKLDGLPVFMLTRMGSSATGEPLPVAAPDNTPPVDVKKEAGKAATSSATDAVLNKLPGIGGIGGFGRKKKEQTQQQQTPDATTTSATSTPQTAAVLMQMETTLQSFSSGPVDSSKFAVPAGFKQVEPEINKRNNR